MLATNLNTIYFKLILTNQLLILATKEIKFKKIKKKDQFYYLYLINNKLSIVK